MFLIHGRIFANIIFHKMIWVKKHLAYNAYKKGK